MNEQRDRWIDIEALMAAGEDGGCPPARAWDDLAEIKEELERLRTEGTPGVVHKLDKSFYKLAIKERDYERHMADSLREEVEELRVEIEALSKQLKHVRAENRYLVFGDEAEERES